MKIITVLIVCLTPAALAEDFITVSGKQYKNAAVIRVEPDGIVLKIKSGIAKLYFVELPKDVQKRFHYGEAKATQVTTAEQAESDQSNAANRTELQAHQQEQQQERQKRTPAVIPSRNRHSFGLWWLFGAVFFTVAVAILLKLRVGYWVKRSFEGAGLAVTPPMKKLTPGQIALIIIVGIVTFSVVIGLIAPADNTDEKERAPLQGEGEFLTSEMERANRERDWSRVDEIRQRNRDFQDRASNYLIRHGRTPRRLP